MSTKDRLVEQAILRYNLAERAKGGRAAPTPQRPKGPPGGKGGPRLGPAVRRVAVLGRLPG